MIDPQTTFQFAGLGGFYGMASVAMLHQNRPDFRFKESHAIVSANHRGNEQACGKEKGALHDWP
jgi:hypothetical protein